MAHEVVTPRSFAVLIFGPRTWTILRALLAGSAVASTGGSSQQRVPNFLIQRLPVHLPDLVGRVRDNCAGDLVHVYDPHFRGADWSGARERYRARVRAVRADSEFQAVADAMLREIPSSHLYISPPATVGSRGIGARFATIEGQRIVTEVAPLSDARARGLLPGDHLLSDPDALRGEFGETATVQVEHCDGRRSRLSIRREHAFWPPEHPGFRWTRLTRSPNESIGYLRIDRFDDGPAALADRAMAELKDTQALIIMSPIVRASFLSFQAP